MRVPQHIVEMCSNMFGISARHVDHTMDFFFLSPDLLSKMIKIVYRPKENKSLVTINTTSLKGTVNEDVKLKCQFESFWMFTRISISSDENFGQLRDIGMKSFSLCESCGGDIGENFIIIFNNICPQGVKFFDS